MTPENFAYWLQGLLEVGKVESLDKEQVQQIKDHLQLVFEKKTPNYGQTTNVPSYSYREMPGQSVKELINIPVSC